MVLQECACGEPLLDDLSTCPQCGTPNPSHRQSRWRIFWPEVESLAGAGEAIQLGYWVAFLAAALGTITSLIPGFGIGVTGLFDAALYAICGVGIRRGWRTAAVVGLLLCATNIVFALSRGGGVGVLTVFIFVGLINGVRGTFVQSRLSRAPRPEGPDDKGIEVTAEPPSKEQI